MPLKEDNLIRCKLPFYYRRHVDPSKSNLLPTTSFDFRSSASSFFVKISLAGHASEILGGRKISRDPTGGFMQQLGPCPVLLGIPCHWNMQSTLAPSAPASQPPELLVCVTESKCLTARLCISPLKDAPADTPS